MSALGSSFSKNELRGEEEQGKFTLTEVRLSIHNCSINANEPVRNSDLIVEKDQLTSTHSGWRRV
jgi:hypothetical protein